MLSQQIERQSANTRQQNIIDLLSSQEQTGAALVFYEETLDDPAQAICCEKTEQPWMSLGTEIRPEDFERVYNWFLS